MKKQGYYIYAYGRDCFIEMNMQKRTKKLALEFINKIQNAINRFDNINEDTIAYIQNAMQPVYCEIKTLGNGRQYYDIYNDSIGGRGDFVDLGIEKTVVIFK